MGRPLATIFAFLCFQAIFSGNVVAQCTTIMEKETFAAPPPGFAYTGMLKHLPAGYATDLNKKYPVIIFLHGYGAMGDGSANQLCRILNDDIKQTPAHKIQEGKFPATVIGPGGESFSYLVFAPQYNNYGIEPPGHPNRFHYSQQTDDLITYLLQNYRIDPARIYLTGASAGANLVLDYVGSSVDHAERIAAVAISSGCYPVSNQPNGPANIAAASLPTWFVHCVNDGADIVDCRVEVADAWVDGITNAGGSAVAPRYDKLITNPDVSWPIEPDTLLYCYNWAHMTWPRVYTELEVTNGPNPNLYKWALQFNRSSLLPVSLKDFSARLMNGKVQVRWITTTEENNLSFTIEKAGADQRFSAIATVPGKGSTSLEQRYDWVDHNPLTGLSYYRLVQTDLSGAQKRFGIKRVMNRNTQGSTLIVSPNPFISAPSAFLNVNRTQQVTITLTDLNGKRLLNRKNQFAVGTTEIQLPVTNLARGIYLLQVSGEDFKETHKLVKQ